MNKITIIVVLVLVVSLVLVISIWASQDRFGAWPETVRSSIASTQSVVRSSIASTQSVVRSSIASTQSVVHDFLRIRIKNEAEPLRTTFGPEWFTVARQPKETNAFKLFELLLLDTAEPTAEPTAELPKAASVDSLVASPWFRELGVGAELIENAPTMEFFMKSIAFGSRRLIFFIKAPDDYRIEKGVLGFADATHIMYCFGGNFGDGIIFKKEMPDGLNKYYVPEKNSIICFTNKDTYETLRCRSQAPNGLRYLMVILIFGNS